jgi:hypothetical protein
MAPCMLNQSMESNLLEDKVLLLTPRQMLGNQNNYDHVRNYGCPKFIMTLWMKM